MFIRRVSLLLAPVTFYASSASRSVNVHFYKLLFTTKERTFFASLENILNVKYPCETINYSSEDFVLKNREKLVSDLTLPRNKNKKKKNKKREEKGSFIHSSFHLYDPTLDNKILEIIRRTKNHLQPLLDRKCVEWCLQATEIFDRYTPNHHHMRVHVRRAVFVGLYNPLALKYSRKSSFLYTRIFILRY